MAEEKTGVTEREVRDFLEHLDLRPGDKTKMLQNIDRIKGLMRLPNTAVAIAEAAEIAGGILDVQLKSADGYISFLDSNGVHRRTRFNIY